MKIQIKWKSLIKNQHQHYSYEYGIWQFLYIYFALCCQGDDGEVT